MNKRPAPAQARTAHQYKKTNRQNLDLPSSTRPPFNEIPKYVQLTSPAVSSAQSINGEPLTATTLPLNLIALIVSFLDDVGDLARVTRTSRLLYYMTLPQLYQRVHLHSYADIRYHNGKPQGYGGGSPFLAALGGLATTGHAALVHEFRVHGEWKEVGVEDFAKGIIPANSMMLNIILRTVSDNMVKLKSFSWELDCKPLKTLYTGLASHNTLTSLTLKFPSARIPRPSVLIPPMANLRVFKVTDIDPMCYPDDISLLLLHSKKLDDVRLHFSPRMRQEAEVCTNLAQFFGRCYKAGYKLKLKHFAIQNFFGPNLLDFESILDQDAAESTVIFDTFGGSDPRTTFVDETWRALPPNLAPSFKRVRVNEISNELMIMLSRQKCQLERLYLVSAQRPRSGFTPASASASAAGPDTPMTAPSSHSVDTPGTPDMDLGTASLRQRGLETINTFHGSGLRHLLLRDCWPLNGDEIASLVRHCPNLEQLGLAVHGIHHECIKLFMPFLLKLKALRILSNDFLVEHLRVYSHEDRMDAMGRNLANNPVGKIAGVGSFVYKIGGLIKAIDADGSMVLRREVTFGTREDAMQWDIWRLDCLDIDVDPVAPNSP